MADDICFISKYELNTLWRSSINPRTSITPNSIWVTSPKNWMDWEPETIRIVATYRRFHVTDGSQRVEFLFTNKTYIISHFGLVALFWP